MTDKKELVEMAYTMGFNCFEHTYSEWADILQEANDPTEVWGNGNEDIGPISDLAREGQHTNSYQQMIWSVEDRLGFDPETQDWDNAGVYGTIEDCAVAWDSGAFDSLMDKDYNPDKVNHLY